MASSVSLQGVAEAVVTPAPEPPPIAVERPEVEYPDTDGKPMADNTWQATTMHYADGVLAIHFRGRGFVATGLLVYYREGENRARGAPDVMLVLGVDGSHRFNYRIWAEGGRAQDFELEVISSSKQERDAMEKRTLYAELGVREYFRYAPLSRRMAGMSGHRPAGEVLREGRWEALPQLEEEHKRSEVLGLDLRAKMRGSGGRFSRVAVPQPEHRQGLAHPPRGCYCDARISRPSPPENCRNSMNRLVLLSRSCPRDPDRTGQA